MAGSTMSMPAHRFQVPPFPLKETSKRLPFANLHPGRLTWNPKNHPIEKENHLPIHHFQVCWSSIRESILQVRWLLVPGRVEHSSSRWDEMKLCWWSRWQFNSHVIVCEFFLYGRLNIISTVIWHFGTCSSHTGFGNCSSRLANISNIFICIFQICWLAVVYIHNTQKLSTKSRKLSDPSIPTSIHLPNTWKLTYPPKK